MEVSAKVTNIIEALKALYPDALCALHYGKDYELMIAVRLSAQCTDAQGQSDHPCPVCKIPHPAFLCRGGYCRCGRAGPLLRLL